MLKLYKCFNNKTDCAAAKYWAAWAALCVLDPGGSWSNRLKELRNEDISGPGKDVDDVSISNSHYLLSWIWLVPCVTESSNMEPGISKEEFNESMRVGWAKAKAHMLRWKEELMIIGEEMQ